MEGPGHVPALASRAGDGERLFGEIPGQVVLTHGDVRVGEHGRLSVPEIDGSGPGPRTLEDSQRPVEAPTLRQDDPERGERARRVDGEAPVLAEGDGALE